MSKNKHNGWMAMALLVAMLCLLSGCGGGTTQADLDSVTVEQLTLEGGQVSLPTISAGSEDGAAQAVAEKINGQLSQAAEAFLQAPGQDGSYAASVCYNRNGMLSVITIEQTADGMNQYAKTYSLATGEPMTLGQVMNKKEGEAEKLILQQLGGVVQSDPATFYPEAASYIQDNLDRMQFYRSEEGLNLFFQPGEIADAGKGVIEIVVQ